MQILNCPKIRTHSLSCLGHSQAVTPALPGFVCETGVGIGAGDFFLLFGDLDREFHFWPVWGLVSFWVLRPTRIRTSPPGHYWHKGLDSSLGWGRPVHCRVLSCITSLDSLWIWSLSALIVATKNAFRHCGNQKCLLNALGKITLEWEPLLLVNPLILKMGQLRPREAN